VRSGLGGLIDTILHIADLNAKDVKVPYTRGRRERLTTAATLEDQEWDAFKARLERRKSLLLRGSADAERDDTTDLDEDDIDLLLAIVGILEKSSGFTSAEVVRELQRAKVLSLEFTAAARAQAQRMLNKLRELNRVLMDANGRWYLVR